MANTKLQFKRTTVSGRLPNTTISANTSYIDAGEFAINLADRKVVSSNGTVTFEVGANLSSLNVASSIAVGGATINSTIYSATANNANNLGGLSLAQVQGNAASNAATAYTNATIYSANATNISSGTVAPDRLGTGANSTNILYGNGVFAAPQSPVAGGNTIITTGTGANQSITLSSVTIVANDIIVTFNGLRQTPNSYAVTSGTLYVTAPANSDVVVQLAGGPVGPTGANGASLVALVQQQYTANGTGTQFAVSGGYSAGAMTVYVNGVKQLETTDVITSSGSNVVFNTAPPSNAQIDIFGFSSLPQIASNTSVVSQQFTANGIANSFIVSGGYTAGSMQVFVNGVKYVESSDVVTNSGTTINFTTAPANGSIVDVFGQVSLPAVTANSLLLIGGTVSGTINVGSNVSITTTGVNVGNSTANTTINATVFAIGNSTVNSTINATAFIIGNSTINSTALVIGNSTVNSTINATALSVGSNVASIGTSVFFLANGVVSIGMPLGDVPSGYGKLVVKGGAAGTTNSNITVSTPGLASDERADIALYSTFGSFPSDTGPRRTADIIAGFTTTWGGEYLSFNVGQGGSSNDSRLLSLEKMRIVSNGNIGIGNTTPGSSLVVTGSVGISGGLTLGNSTVNTTANSTGFYVNGSASDSYPSRILTTNSLLLSTDGIVQANNSLTLTLMAASTVAGKQFFIRNINTSDVNIVGNTSSETINGYANIVMQFKNSSLGLISTGSSWIIN